MSSAPASAAFELWQAVVTPATPTPELTLSFSDGLGDRLVTSGGAAASSIEMLRFKREFAEAPGFESALRDRVERLQHFRHPDVASALRVEWLENEGLVLVSNRAAGRRLSELLPRSGGPVAAQEILRRVIPALAALQQSGDHIVHGALAPERIVVGPDGRFVVVEHVLGSALDSLRLSPGHLRAELGLAVPSADGVGLYGPIDVIQIGFVALSLLLGRRLDPAAYPDKVVALLDESAETESGASWAASRLRSWIERTLQIGMRAFDSASDACAALDELPSEAQLQPSGAYRTSVPAGSATASLTVAAPAGIQTPALESKAQRARLEIAKAVQAAAVPPVTFVPPVQNTFPAPQTAAIHRSPHASAVRTPGPSGRRSSVTGWIAGGLAGLAVAEAVIIVSLLYPTPKVVAERNPAQVETPVTGRGARAPARKVSTRASRGVLPVSPTAAEGKLLLPERFGKIQVSSAIDLRLYEDGNLIGSSAGPVTVSEGLHTFDMLNEAAGYRLRKTVNITAGQMLSLAVPIPSGRLTINALPWAEVVIDGNPAGQTPLANLSIPIGPHQIVFRHPQFGEQRQTAVVTLDGITRVIANLQR